MTQFLGLLSEPETPDDMPAYKQAKLFFKKCSDVSKSYQITLSFLLLSLSIVRRSCIKSNIRHA